MNDDSMNDKSMTNVMTAVRFLLLVFFIGSSFIESSFIALAAEGEQANPPYAEATGGTPAYLFQLSYDDAEEAIGQALIKKGAGTKLSVSINGNHEQPLFSYSKPISVEIHGLQFEKPSRWSANLFFVADGNVLSAIPVAGRYEEIITVPVLRREVRNGDVIGEADIEMRDFPVTRTRTDTVTDIAQIIGKSPVEAISPERPVRLHEISSPAVVKKNGIVSMRFISPGMEITATGQAMQEGAKGDVIQVRNTVSRKIVRAVIADANIVDIVGVGEPYAAN